MNFPFISDETFKNETYSLNAIVKADYDNCTLINCDFSESYLINISFLDCEFKDCKLEQTDFIKTNLSDCKFFNCNLRQTVFDNSVLERADFRTSYNLSLNPEKNNIKKACFSKENALGLFSHHEINIE